VTSFSSRVITFALCCSLASAAALVPVPGFQGSLPVSGLEQNKGQGKPGILFFVRGLSSMAVTAQAVQYSPLGAELAFVAGNTNPVVRFSDPQPGLVNSATGADPQKWVTGISRFARAQLTGVYPGVDAEYAMAADGQLTLNLLCSPGTDTRLLAFEVAKAVGIQHGSDGSLRIQLGSSRFDPALGLPAPIARQGNTTVPVSYVVQTGTRFTFQLGAYDQTSSLRIEMTLGGSITGLLEAGHQTTDASGNTFVLATIPDAAPSAACDNVIGFPIPCTDVVVYKVSKAGQLIFASYLSGSTRESGSFLQLAPDGALLVTGSTDSADFPVSRTALQAVYAGPAAKPSGTSSFNGGDFFASRIDATTGLLLASTYLGGPNADTAGDTALGADGSVYFLPKWLGSFSARMPATASALQPACQGDPCLNAYVAHLSPSLDRLLYATYLPGTPTSSAKLHSDGSVYYAGYSTGGFPVTAGAYQQAPVGKEDAIVGRLDPSGSKLIFGTYIGGADTDWILRIAVAPDGSVWAAVSSFVQCCINIRNRLVRFDPNGQRLLADKPIDVGDLAVDTAGNLHATAAGPFTVGPDAFLGNTCGLDLSYIKLSPSGEQLFASYLPFGTGSDFNGKSLRGSPILTTGGGRFEVVEGQSMGVYAGCVLDAASFGNPDTISPGEIVTLFGSRMGPMDGIAFRPQEGRVPTSLGGTRVLVNGEPVPVLFASYGQVNAILPYSLQEGMRPKIQVESNGSVGNELAGSFVQRARIALFRTDNTANPPAAALNEDGTVNSARNPAKKGSRVMLFGTGGGPTVPASAAGEITPLELRPLQYGASARIAQSGPMLTVEFAGAAPGLLAGVIQINVKLPDAISDIEGYPKGVLPLFVNTPEFSFYPAYATVAVDGK